jgi:aspartate/methionine/tyrosine aminotransferase
LGWLVVPDALVPVIERLAQNLFICASTVAQYAALACFEAESIDEYERRRAEFKARRDYFVPALNALGLTVPVMPDGAFYAWADCSAAAKKLGMNVIQFGVDYFPRTRGVSTLSSMSVIRKILKEMFTLRKELRAIEAD